MKASWMGVIAGVLLLNAGPAMSQHAQPYRSMEVTGTIVVNPDGRVAGYALNHADKLPPAALQAISKNVPWWKFKPVVRNGKPVSFTSRMSVRLVATPAPNETYSISVGGAYFWSHGAQQPPDVGAAANGNKPPRYPLLAKREHVSGVVYLVMQVDRRGRVQRVAAEQVDLFAPLSVGSTEHARMLLARASVDAARKWTFAVPETSELAADGYLYVHKPVRFELSDCDMQRCTSTAAAYGSWQAYIPGPEHVVPWLDPQLVASGSADAIPADDSIYPMRQSLQLLTPLGNGS